MAGDAVRRLSGIRQDYFTDVKLLYRWESRHVWAFFLSEEEFARQKLLEHETRAVFYRDVDDDNSRMEGKVIRQRGRKTVVVVPSRGRPITVPMANILYLIQKPREQS